MNTPLIVCTQNNPDGVSVVTWYSQLHHMAKGNYSAMSKKRADVGTTAVAARSVMQKAGVAISCLEQGISDSGMSNGGAVWDSGGLRVEVRAVITVAAGQALTVRNLELQIGPWLALASQQDMLQRYIDRYSAGSISIRKQEFSTYTVLRQAKIAMFLLTKCLQGKSTRSQLTQKARFMVLLLANSIGYSNPRWNATFLRLAACSAERRILKQVYDAIYCEASSPAMPAVPLFPQSTHSAEQVSLRV